MRCTAEERSARAFRYIFCARGRQLVQLHSFTHSAHFIPQTFLLIGKTQSRSISLRGIVFLKCQFKQQKDCSTQCATFAHSSRLTSLPATLHKRMPLQSLSRDPVLNNYLYSKFSHRCSASLHDIWGAQRQSSVFRFATRLWGAQRHRRRTPHISLFAYGKWLISRPAVCS